MLFLGLLKLFAGLVSGITVIITDAISSFADILGVFASYFGLKLSRKTADSRFEYGYYKIETLAALIISLGIIFLGYKTIQGSIINFNHTPKGTNYIFAVVASIFAMIQSYHLSKKLQSAGEEANSLALIASAQDKKMDVVASAVVLFSVVANYKGIPYVESVVSIIIGIFILKVGFLTAKESLFFLLDYWNDPLLSRKIKKILLEENDVISQIKKIRLRRAGTFIFGEAFVEINPFSDIHDLKSELNLVQTKIENLSIYLKDFSIYSHIPNSQNFRIAIPLKTKKELNSEVARNEKETKYYLFANIRNKRIKDFYVKKLNVKDRKVIQLTNFLKSEKINILLNNQLSSLAYYNLRRTHQVLIYPMLKEVKTANDAIKLILIDN